MKKNNTYLAEDEINLRDFIKLLWREKILILSISIICGLAAYLYAFFKPQESRAEILIKNPPFQLFELYTEVFSDNINFNNFIGGNTNDNKSSDRLNSLSGQFISDFKLNFLSLDNLESFVEESKEFDNLKKYLKRINISAKVYFKNKINTVKENNSIIPNKYYLVYKKKEFDGDFFLNNYAKFVKKKTIADLKINLKLSIKSKIAHFNKALSKAKLTNIENPILTSISESNQIQVVNEPQELFYKGSKILEQDIIFLEKLLIILENDQFNFNNILEKSLTSDDQISKFLYFAGGIMFGLFLSFGIIFFKDILKV